ncbi:MAG: pyridoxamine 5'-phosphate oxidase family protein [Cyanomargarita calcarea GSE-NOS-MK-12-04C]|jgi:PPOX class probable FMN-dependent enzyme|uniref:Pyridoxamine 5'-phosphate oxidase family protein n=1 Tax=Cyanomargarita calcarea GSE-NOS-MK-12-04C TaxID=2839659 RepID=A0A951UYH4_9CYAN|nr:pyridoxamine 5'-phosphate oxidase family protein [Cyanomargarita calcarea GSE-NOS-MK-12-04C]
MSLAPWRGAIAHALHRNRSLVYARYLQLATVRTSGRPANRTVVFRGFLEDTNQLKFITDTRSQKTEQIQEKPWAEICWYFPNTREQFRIGGCLTLVGGDNCDSTLQKARNTTWHDLSDGARLQFAWPHPGKPRVEEKGAFSPPPPDSTQPLENFCLLVLEPVEVDHLELRGEPQNRYLYQLSQEGWSSQAINP